MSGADDKARMRELGTGIMVLIGVLLVLAVLSVVQLTFVLRAANEMASNFDPELNGFIFGVKFLAILKVILYAASVFALFFSSNRIAVFFTIGAVVFGAWGVLGRVVQLALGEESSVFTPLMLIDLAILGGIVGYLLFSRSVEGIYHTGTRKLLTRGTANAWRRIRGRPTLDQIEASRLENTFD